MTVVCGTVNTHYGVVAKQIEEVLPEVVKDGLDGEKAVAED